MFLKWIRLTTFAIFALIFTHPCLAIEQYNGFWDRIFINAHSKNHPYLFQLQIEDRFRNGLEKASLQPAIGYKAVNTSFWLGYSYFETYPFKPSLRSSENRFWQQIIWPDFSRCGVALTPRTRLESRKRNDRSQWNEVFRQLLTFTFDTERLLGSNIVLFDEIFCNLNHPVQEDARFIKENRFYIGLQNKFSKKFQMDIGYLNRFEPRKNRPFMGHILLLTLSFDVNWEIATTSH